MFEIVRTLHESDCACDFVAIGHQCGNLLEHSVFIIHYNNKFYQFEFLDGIVFTENVDDSYHKITDTINKLLVPSFITYCKQISKHAKPKFGFFYSGEYYDKEGNHFSKSKTGERMTCVGFCLNVLKGFLEDDYIQYADWEESSHSDTPHYLQEFAIEHDLNTDEISDSHRRITPLELLTSAFFTKIPIKKADIDSKIDYVKAAIEVNNPDAT